MKLELTQKLQQQQILAPQMILSMDILLLAVSELEQRIEKELTENPALEVSEISEPVEHAAPEPDGHLSKESQELFEKIDSFENQTGSLYERRSRRVSGDGDERLEMLQNTEG